MIKGMEKVGVTYVVHGQQPTPLLHSEWLVLPNSEPRHFDLAVEAVQVQVGYYTVSGRLFKTTSQAGRVGHEIWRHYRLRFHPSA